MVFAYPLVKHFLKGVRQRALSNTTVGFIPGAAHFGGAHVQAAVASWASPCPFIRFYLGKVFESSLTHSVLHVLDCRSMYIVRSDTFMHTLHACNPVVLARGQSLYETEPLVMYRNSRFYRI